MYDIAKNVIKSRNYELSDMLKKIDTMWIQGRIDESQKNELILLARENATPENSYAGLQEQINILRTELESIKKIMAGDSTDAVEEYPAYKQPSGDHDAYNSEDKVTYLGTKFICKMDGCVWNPDVYPDAWERVENE